MLAAAPVRADDGFLDVDQAFRLSGHVGAKTELGWTIADCCTLYRDRIHLRVDGREIAPQMPAAQTKAGDDGPVAVYHHRLALSLDLPAGARRIEVEYQGCADAGLCYPPQLRSAALGTGGDLAFADPASGDPGSAVKTVKFDAAPDPVRAGFALEPHAAAASAAPARTIAASPAAAAPASPDGIAGILSRGHGIDIVASFVVFGLLLSFTPCVLPMVPILSAILVGQRASSRARGLKLAAAYSLGMAGVYTATGVAAGLAGEGLAAWMQQPPVLAGFALLLAALSLSMFDVYQLQMSGALQSRLASASDRLGGGGHLGAFAMGALSALMVGPCVAAPLAGVLLYIGRSHDVVIGALALFALATGMSVPLMLAGASAGSLLPRAGAWMERVKHFFGVVLLAVAWWTASPLIPASLQLAGWGILALAAAVLLGLLDAMPAKAGPGPRLGRALLIALAVIGSLELVGAAAGAEDALAPLGPLAHARVASPAGGAPAAGGVEGAGSAEPRFSAIQSPAELDRALAASDRPVLLDFYADWCVACKEMDRQTFRDSRVAAALAGYRLLRADVTQNGEAQRALLKRFGLFGPPGIVFFDRDGVERAGQRLVGFMPAGEFVAHL